MSGPSGNQLVLFSSGSDIKCILLTTLLTFDVVIIIVIKHNHALLNNLLVHKPGTEKAHFITR